MYCVISARKSEALQGCTLSLKLHWRGSLVSNTWVSNTRFHQEGDTEPIGGFSDKTSTASHTRRWVTVISLAIFTCHHVFIFILKLAAIPQIPAANLSGMTPHLDDDGKQKVNDKQPTFTEILTRTTSATGRCPCLWQCGVGKRWSSRCHPSNQNYSGILGKQIQMSRSVYSSTQRICQPRRIDSEKTSRVVFKSNGFALGG